MKFLKLLAALAALALGAPVAFAQPVDSALYSPTYLSTSSSRKEAIGTFCIDPATGLVCSGGGGGGGGGDASASNQSAQIVQETLTNTILGAVTASPTANTVNDRLKSIFTSLGSPFQAGGSIGNTAFGATQSGTWNITNVSGTISLPTLAATSTLQTSGAQKTQIVDGSGNVIAATSNALNVSCGNCSGTSYSIANAATYANTGSYSNLPAGGLVATAAPTYTTGQASPLSLATTGSLRVECTTGCSGGAGASAKATAAAPSYSEGATVDLSVDLAGNLRTTGAGGGGGDATAANQTTLNGLTGALTETAPASDTASSGLNGRLQRVAQRLTTLNTTLGTPLQAGGNVVVTSSALPTGAATAAKQPALGTAGTASTDVISVQGIAAGTPIQTATTYSNPTSVLTRPANTTAYAAADVIASSTTSGSIVVPSATVARVAAGSVSINRVRLNTSATTGMGGVNIQVDLWTAAPTFTNGDNGVYAIATGAASYVGTATITLQQFADGGVGTALIADGPIKLKLASGQLLYWTAQTLSVFTPTSGQTFTLTVEADQN